MKKNIFIKYKKIFIILILILFTLTTCVFANPLDLNQFQPNQVNAPEVETFGNAILGVIQVIGAIISVIVLIILGIKYMVGSAAEKAEYKKTMVPYLIGAILLFGTPQILQVIYEWAQGL